jgi:hypothetical protein
MESGGLGILKFIHTGGYLAGCSGYASFDVGEYALVRRVSRILEMPTSA